MGRCGGTKYHCTCNKSGLGRHAPAIKRTGRTTHEIKIVGGRGYWRSVSRGARFGTGQDRYPERSVARLCRLWRQIFAEAARMAVEDFGGEVLGQKIEIVTADHQNMPD